MLNLFCARSAHRCFVFSCRASETTLGLARLLLGCSGSLVEQKWALEELHASPKPEMGEITEMKDDDEKAVVYRDPQPRK